MSKAHWEFELPDLPAAEQDTDTDRLAEIEASRTETQTKRRKYRHALDEQYRAANEVNTLVTNLFPELETEVQTLKLDVTTLSQGSVGGVERREFDVYEHLEHLQGKCYLSAIGDEKVVLKKYLS